MLTTSERTEPFANILDISCCSYVHCRHHNVNYFFIYNQFLFHNANIVKKIEKVKKKLKNFDKISFFNGPPYPPHQYYGPVVVAHECCGLTYVVLVGKVYVKLVLVPFRRYLVGCDSSGLHAYHVGLSFYNLSQCLHIIAIIFVPMAGLEPARAFLPRGF